MTDSLRNLRRDPRRADGAVRVSNPATAGDGRPASERLARTRLRWADRGDLA